MALSAIMEPAAGVREEAVRIPVGDEVLRGNLILPGEVDLGVVFIHGWGGVRSGPHALLTRLARDIGVAGVSSIRFDLRGRGESSGAAVAADLVTMAEDSLAAARLLKERAGVSKLVLVGICSGGNVGIGILDRLPEVSGLFLLSVYPFGDGDSFKRDARRSLHYMKEYWKKLWLPQTWKKLGRGEIDFGAVCRILLRPLRRKQTKPQEQKEDVPQPRPLDNLLLHRPKLQMIYGETDPDYQASREYYEAFATEKSFPLGLETIPGANHNFYSLEWTETIVQKLRSFLKEVQ